MKRYVERRQTQLLIWALGLLWYGLSTATQALGNLRGWDPLTYRWWYLSGAFYTAAYLGMGSIYLVAPRGVAHGILAGLVTGSVMVAPLVLLVPLDLTRLPAPGEAPTGQAFPFAVRIVTPLFNLFGAGALIGGAIWGAYHFWRSGRPPRAVANLLIAGGALVPSLTSGLTRFGFTAGLALGQLLGVWLILAGFLLAIRATAPRPAPAEQRAAGDLAGARP